MKIIAFILFMSILIFIACMMNEMERKKLEKEEALKKAEQEAIRKQRKEEENFVITFAFNNGVDIKKLLKERDELYIRALREYAIGRFTEPLKPTTVKARYSGSIIGAFGDYRAEQINKERQQKYNEALESCNNFKLIGMNVKREYQMIEKNILHKLRNIPGGDRYVRILERYFEEDEELFSSLKKR